MSKLIQDAQKAYQTTLEQQERRRQEADERRQREYDEARSEALARAEKVLDQVLGRHDGLRLYALLGGMNDMGEMRHVSSVDSVRTVIFTIEGDYQAKVKLAVSLKGGCVRVATHSTATADSDYHGWFLHDFIRDLSDLGKALRDAGGNVSPAQVAPQAETDSAEGNWPSPSSDAGRKGVDRI